MLALVCSQAAITQELPDAQVARVHTGLLRRPSRAGARELASQMFISKFARLNARIKCTEVHKTHASTKHVCAGPTLLLEMLEMVLHV